MKDKPTDLNNKQKELSLEEQINDIEKKLSDDYFQLGKEVHDTLYPKISEINKLVDQLTAARVQLLKLRGMTICENCLAPNPIDNKYCKRCGRKM